MIFPQKKLAKSHSEAYRQIQLPASVSSIWIKAGVEHVVIEYVEGENDYLIVRPVRVPGTKSATAQAKATTSVESKSETADHSAAAHFRVV